MNAIQTALASQRFNRLLLIAGVIVLAVGATALVVVLAGGSDSTPQGPAPGFKAQLPQKSTPLKNASGAEVKTFEQLDPNIRSTVRTFLLTAVARKNIDQSWPVIAPSFKQGYTRKEWRTASQLPVIPYPFDSIKKVEYYLDYASNHEILMEVGLGAPERYKLRPTTFQLGLVPVGSGSGRHWAVDYWMPRWTPPLPEN
jgi:hypothetical protein